MRTRRRASTRHCGIKALTASVSVSSVAAPAEDAARDRPPRALPKEAAVPQQEQVEMEQRLLQLGATQRQIDDAKAGSHGDFQAAMERLLALLPSHSVNTV